MPDQKPSANAASPEPDDRPAGGGHHGNGHRAGYRKLSEPEVIAALQASFGIRTAAAKRLGVATSTLHSFLAERPGLIEALRQIDEEVVDVVEAKLLKAVHADDIRAITFFLSCRAKHRGYTTRVEATGADGGAIRHEVALPDADDMLALLHKLAAERRAKESQNGSLQ